MINEESSETQRALEISALAETHGEIVDPDVDPPRPLTLLVTYRLLKVWITAHVLFILLGGAFGAYLFVRQTGEVMVDSLLASVLMAFAGAGAYYFRRVYKSAISGRMEIISPECAQERRRRVVGTTLYILGRPLIAALLALFVAMGTAVAWLSVAPANVEPTRGLVQICAISGFLVGYFSGRSLSQLEDSGKIVP